ncbi:MAG: C39 family peptidase [Patescibacteria group bacterium]
MKHFIITSIIGFLFLIPLHVSAKEIFFPNVPFTSQAPLGEWKDARLQNGCEEASVIMALTWVQNEKLTRSAAQKEIIALSDFQKKKYGSFVDTSPHDTEVRLIRGYYTYSATQTKLIKTIGDLIHELARDAILLIQVDGRILKNPYYTGQGPEHHMLVVVGYDQATKEFITNDPGTKRGEHFRYPEKRFFKAINDYPTGDHQKRKGIQKHMIVVSKK